MAGKLITIEEAAKLLGVSVDAVSEMRQRQELFGVRDGGSWKFKSEDVERARTERSAGSAAGGSSPSLSGLDVGSESDVVLSERELGDSGAGPSTVIGGGKSADQDIELKLAGTSGLSLLDSGTGAASKAPEGPQAPAAKGSSASGLNLGEPSGLGLLAGSDVKLAEPSGIVLPGDSSNVLSSGSAGASGGMSGKTVLSADAPLKGESSIKLTMRDDESIFSTPESDVSRNIEGSGIGLLSAGDSGLSLDDLKLAASGIGSNKKKGGSDLGMQSEDDFLLTPLEDQNDESTDSGSQVIALEGEFGDDATATLMSGDVPGLGGMLEDAGGLAPIAPGGMGQPIYVTAPEPSYGPLAVAALGVSTLIMTLVGIMMYDLVRHMWSWDTPYSFNSSLMDMILSLFG